MLIVFGGFFTILKNHVSAKVRISMSKTITLFEYEYDKVNSFVEKHFLLLEEIRKKTCTVIKDSYHNKKRTIKATSFVGVVQLHDLTVEVLPKIHRNDSEDNKTDKAKREAQEKDATNNLLFMLNYTSRLKIKEVDAGLKDRKDKNIFEVLIYLFAKNLFNLLSAGMNKTYMAVEDESRFLKGQWRLDEQLAVKPYANHLFFVRYDEFTEDDHLNRILKYTAKLLTVFSRNRQNKKILEDILLIYSDVADLPEVSDSDISKVQFNRMNERFKHIFDFAMIFIKSLSYQLRGGNKGIYSFMFDMNLLFEEFIAEFIRKEVLPKNDCKYNLENVRIHNDYKYLAYQEDKAEEKIFRLEPDIHFVKDGSTDLIIDTKYKLLGKGKSEKKYGVSQSDMYQMFAYAQKYNCPRVVLLYPHHEKLKTEAGLQKTFYFDKGKNQRVEVWSVDLALNFSDDKSKLVISLTDVLEYNREVRLLKFM